MEDATRAHDGPEISGARALSFGTIAEDYDRYRPEAPDEAVEWLLPRAGVSVVEIGAGTGALTRRVLPRAGDLTAVEPDPRMAAVLRRRARGARVVTGRGENLPLPSRCADAFLAQSCWHWVDQTLGFPEAARVLRSGGVMGLLWVGPDRTVPWVSRLMNWGRVVDPDTSRAQEERRRIRHQPVVPEGAPFGRPVVRRFESARRSTTEELVGLTLTYSPAIATDPDARSALREDTTRFLESRPELRAGAVALPLRCLVWRATRL